MSVKAHSGNKIPSVFIADASPLDCQLLAASLLRNRMRVAGWTTTSANVQEGVTRCKPEVALIGVRLEDGERAGLDALRELQGLITETRIVMLLDSNDRSVVVEAFRFGARGVFSREQVSANLAKCIRSVLAGQLWANTEQVHYLLEELRAHPYTPIASAAASDVLTKRECDVGMLVAEGLTNRDIAERLGLSEHTVKNYLLVMFEKLRVSTRVELALIFVSGRRQPAAKAHTTSENDPAIPA